MTNMPSMPRYLGSSSRRPRRRWIALVGLAIAVLIAGVVAWTAIFRSSFPNSTTGVDPGALITRTQIARDTDWRLTKGSMCIPVARKMQDQRSCSYNDVKDQELGIDTWVDPSAPGKGSAFSDALAGYRATVPRSNVRPAYLGPGVVAYYYGIFNGAAPYGIVFTTRGVTVDISDVPVGPALKAAVLQGLAGTAIEYIDGQ